MSKIILNDYKKILSKDIIKLAQKMLVRELDEVKPSQYESYVDDGNETYDLTLSVNKTGAVAKSACDCEDDNKTFCVHKTAVLISIVEKRKVGSKIVKIKANPLQLLLQEADADKIKDWVWELLQKNKDLELAFKTSFTPKPTSYTKEDVLLITENAYKIVIKNKKNIEQSEIKKLIELWGNVHSPIVTNYLNDLTDYNNFLNILAIADSCKTHHHKLNINSVKIHSYVNSLLLKTLQPLNDFINESSWLKVTNYFINAIPDNDKILRDYFFIYILKLIEISNPTRKEILIDLLTQVFKICKVYHLYDGDHPSKRLLEIIESNGLFNKYSEIFQPITFDNQFNIKLIEALIENKHYSIAEKHCYAQISDNYREEYNTAYFKFLKTIFTQTNNRIGLEDVCKKLLPLTFDFNDFIFINSLFIDETVQKDFRNKIFTKAKGYGRNGNFIANKFCFQILDFENKYSKMIETINSYTHFSLILEYFEKMFSAKKDELIKTILNKSDGWMSYSQKEENKEEVFILLFEKIKIHYGEAYTDLAFKSNPESYYNNKFVSYVNSKILG